MSKQGINEPVATSEPSKPKERKERMIPIPNPVRFPNLSTQKISRILISFVLAFSPIALIPVIFARLEKTRMTQQRKNVIYALVKERGRSVIAATGIRVLPKESILIESFMNKSKIRTRHAMRIIPPKTKDAL